MSLKLKLRKLKEDIICRYGLGRKNDLPVRFQLTDLSVEEMKLIEDMASHSAEPLSLEMQGIVSDCKLLRGQFLSAKIDDFIEWYYDNMVKRFEFNLPKEKQKMRNFIEKMAVWYELRYPNYKIDELINRKRTGEIDIDDVMFNSNPYVNDNVDSESDVRYFEWTEFYNVETFIGALSPEERRIFSTPRYQEIVFLSLNSSMAHLHLTPLGIVEIAEDISIYTKGKVDDSELVGLHIKEVLELFNMRNVRLESSNEIEEALTDIENWNQQKEYFLDCVMYRIIERGGSKFGPRRGFLFAQEFKRNINIPMMYGIDTSDTNLRCFINEYLKSGGSVNLICFANYFSSDRCGELEKCELSEVLKESSASKEQKYTKEETDLHQRLVDSLSTQIDPDTLKKEKVKQLRIMRRLEKSRKVKE